jgi:hypothetical protein
VEVLAAGLVMVLVPIVIEVRSWSARKDVQVIERTVRFGASAGFSLTFVIGGAFLLLARGADFTGSRRATSPASWRWRSTPGCC